jgi:hypothetical protein
MSNPKPSNGRGVRDSQEKGRLYGKGSITQRGDRFQSSFYDTEGRRPARVIRYP